MKHAFLITAYTDARQLLDLVNAFDSPGSSFYIHIDAKSGLAARPEIASLRKRSNIRILEKPVKVFWGGFSHFRAILMLLEAGVAGGEADYLHLLSGQCFPIRSFAEFDGFFEKNKGKEFITCAPLSQMNWSGGSLNRLQLYHLNDLFNIRVRFWKRINSRFLQLQRALGARRKLSFPYTDYFGGGTWWSLSREASTHILDVFKGHPGLLNSLRYTHCAEEIVFQTILGNSPFQERIMKEDLRYVDWSTRDGNCPVVLDERDLDALAKSGKLIGRKFASGKSDRLKSFLRNNFPIH
jgi:hypothetical protein